MWSSTAAQRRCKYCKHENQCMYGKTKNWRQRYLPLLATHSIKASNAMGDEKSIAEGTAAGTGSWIALQNRCDLSGYDATVLGRVGRWLLWDMCYKLRTNAGCAIGWTSWYVIFGDNKKNVVQDMLVFQSARFLRNISGFVTMHLVVKRTHLHVLFYLVPAVDYLQCLCSWLWTESSILTTINRVGKD